MHDFLRDGADEGSGEYASAMRAHDDFRRSFISGEIANDFAGITHADMRCGLKLVLLHSSECRGQGFFALFAVIGFEAFFADKEFDVDRDDGHLHIEQMQAYGLVAGLDSTDRVIDRAVGVLGTIDRNQQHLHGQSPGRSF